jgi:thioesterase domain-containing protein
VALLALLDTHNHAVLVPADSVGARLRHYAQKASFHWSNLMGVEMGGRLMYLREKWRMAREATAARVGARWRQFGSLLKGQRDETAPYAPMERINDRAAAAYRPGPYPGVVTIFKPRRNYDSFSDTQQGWGDVALGGLREIELPVNPHAMLVEPYVEKLANQLRPLLDAVADGSLPKLGSGA